MSGDILTYPTDTAVSADDFVATEKVSGNMVLRQKVNPENLKVRPTGNSTARTLAAVASDLDVTAAGTSTASKAAVLGTSKNLDILGLPVGGLKIGAAGSEVAVGATAAEIDAGDISAKVTFIDDFLGDVLVDPWTIITGNDAQAVAAAIVAGVSNGTVAMTSGDSNPGVTAADASGIVLGRNWAASQGGLIFEARVKLDAITTVKAFIGLTDTIALEFPIISNGTTGLTATADDAVGFLFDTIGTDPDAWMTAGVKATVATARTKGSAPVADTYDTLRIEISTAGTASFYQNGTLVATVANSVTAATLLTPVLIVMENGVAATRKLTVDYVYVQQNR